MLRTLKRLKRWLRPPGKADPVQTKYLTSAPSDQNALDIFADRSGDSDFGFVPALHIDGSGNIVDFHSALRIGRPVLIDGSGMRQTWKQQHERTGKHGLVQAKGRKRHDQILVMVGWVA